MAVETLLGTDGPASVDVGRVVVALTTGDATLVTPPAGKKVRVLEFGVGSAGTVTLTFKSATTAVAGPIPLVAGSSAGAGFSPVGCFETAAGEALVATLSGSVNVGGWLNYALVN